MAEKTLITVFRQYGWRGVFEGEEDPGDEVTAQNTRVNFVDGLTISYDTDPETLVEHTVVSDAQYGFGRVTVVEIP